MRISTEYGDPGFREDALVLDLRIELDGEVVRNCVMADSDKGELKVMGYMPAFRVARVATVYTPARPGVEPTWTYAGKVEIIENVTERRL